MLVGASTAEMLVLLLMHPSVHADRASRWLKSLPLLEELVHQPTTQVPGVKYHLRLKSSAVARSGLEPRCVSIAIGRSAASSSVYSHKAYHVSEARMTKNGGAAVVITQHDGGGTVITRDSGGSFGKVIGLAAFLSSNGAFWK